MPPLDYAMIFAGILPIWAITRKHTMPVCCAGHGTGRPVPSPQPSPGGRGGKRSASRVSHYGRRALPPALAVISCGCFLPDLTRFTTLQCGETRQFFTLSFPRRQESSKYLRRSGSSRPTQPAAVSYRCASSILRDRCHAPNGLAYRRRP